MKVINYEFDWRVSVTYVVGEEAPKEGWELWVYGKELNGDNELVTVIYRDVHPKDIKVLMVDAVDKITKKMAGSRIKDESNQDAIGRNV